MAVVQLPASAVGAGGATDAQERLEADLLIVGGTESGCAAAVQAARMGVRKIVLVNDIKWLGGQFSAEALGAVDENRGHDYDGTVPIPRSGLFREVIDAVEAHNAKLYGGIKRPGHTRVITTARPVVCEQAFRNLLAPYERFGQLMRRSNYRVRSVTRDGDRVVGVVFESTTGETRLLTVRARLTIDASDWGDAIRASGAAYDFGIDARSEFGEPSAPESNLPRTDMNPITWGMILVEQPKEMLILKPAGYDATSFQGTWGWIQEDFAYESRRLVDGHGFAEIDHPDVLLINNPNTDYPLDRHPVQVAAALEASRKGASTKNIVDLTPAERRIIFDDARNRSLQYLYYLQSKYPKFRRMALSDEFGTVDSLPPKPYIRESLRLVARHIVTEQEVLGFGDRSNYATAMFPDAVFSWQFELDFHPTARHFLEHRGQAAQGGDEEDTGGPWEAGFRGNRRFGRGGTGRAVFPLRSLVPVKIQGLLGAQKHLGYTSIVSSSCRLHDQSMAAGQACGAVAAVSLRRNVDPGRISFDAAALADVWTGLLEGGGTDHAVPLAIWPFADLEPDDAGFVAVQQLALRRLLPLRADDTRFRPDGTASEPWRSEIGHKVTAAGYQFGGATLGSARTRRDVAIAMWREIAAQPIPAWRRVSPTDADGDGIRDESDPLPFTRGTVSWEPLPDRDGLPDIWPPGDRVEAFNFTSAAGPAAQGFQTDVGAPYSEQVGYGWLRDLRANTRLRKLDRQAIRDGFVFTRTQDAWQRKVDNGRYKVTVCIGDAGHDQPGQNVRVEDTSLAANVSTTRGSFRELQAIVEVQDGLLTVTLGNTAGGSNTVINWLLIEPRN